MMMALQRILYFVVFTTALLAPPVVRGATQPTKVCDPGEIVTCQGNSCDNKAYVDCGVLCGEDLSTNCWNTTIQYSSLDCHGTACSTVNVTQSDVTCRYDAGIKWGACADHGGTHTFYLSDVTCEDKACQGGTFEKSLVNCQAADTTCSRAVFTTSAVTGCVDTEYCDWGGCGANSCSRSGCCSPLVDWTPNCEYTLTCRGAVFREMQLL